MEQELVRWITDPPSDNGIRFAEGDDWQFHSYGELAEGVQAASGSLLRSGCAYGTVTLIIVPGGPDFVSVFFGVLAAGGTPCVVAPPYIFEDLAAYIDHLASILRRVKPNLVVATNLHADIVREASNMADWAINLILVGELGQGRPVLPTPVSPSSTALLQFTSGSTGRPRGIELSWMNLESNLDALRRWLGVTPSDSIATWLPMYHDMGLVGCLLMPMSVGLDIWIQRPEQFIANPARWLESLGRYGATLTTAPNFGYAFAAKKVAHRDIDGLDFSHCKAFIAGAERIDPLALQSFANLLQDQGFRTSMFFPGYGLAEATLGVAGKSRGASPRVVSVDWSRLEFGEAVRVLDKGLLDEKDVRGSDGTWLVGCGGPLPGMSFAITDDQGEPLPDQHLGEIVVRGRSVAVGYRDVAGGSPTRLGDGIARTGDAGFIVDGELYVMGRIGDGIKVRGRFLHSDNVEALIRTRVPAINPGRCVAVCGVWGGQESVAILIEQPADTWVEDLIRVLMRHGFGDGILVQVVCVARGTIKRTSSGKPRRRLLWDDLIGERLPGEVVFDSRSELLGR